MISETFASMLTRKSADRFFIQLLCVTVKYSSKCCVTGEF